MNTTEDLMEDRYGLSIGTNSLEAASLYSKGLERLQTQQGGAADLLTQCVAIDPEFALAYSALGVAKRADGDIAGGAQSISKAAGFLGRLGEREKGHITLTNKIIRGEIRSFIEMAQVHLTRWPLDSQILQLTLANLNIGVGLPNRDQEMLAIVTKVGSHYENDWFHTAAYAFALEETRQFGQAQDLGEQALELKPNNSRASHVLAHTYLETGRGHEGDAFLRNWLDQWEHPGGFQCHLTWHRALFALAAGDPESAKELLREVISWLGRSIAVLTDGSSLAWRLHLDGFSEDLPWETLGALPDRVGFGFGNAHRAIVLAGLADTEGLSAYAVALDDAAIHEPTLSSVALWTRGLRAFVSGNMTLAAEHFDTLLPSVRDLCGSHAQTEVYLDTHIASLERCGRKADAARMLRKRLAARGSVRDQNWLARVS
jgi:tetratricopeptide (TPR) repeat protein